MSGAAVVDSFRTRGRLTVGEADYEVFRLAGVEGADRLPFSLKVLLENLLRNEDGREVTADDIRALAAWDPGARPDKERGVWPRLVVAVPDVGSQIVAVVRVAADAADLLFVTGRLGFTPDDITRRGVATAFFRDVHVDAELARRFRRSNPWADERIAAAAATFPVDATPLEIDSGGVPGFRLRNAYVLPGVPAEMRSMFRTLTLPVEQEPIHRTVVTVPTTEDRIRRTLEQFAVGNPAVRLGSYPDLDTDPLR